MAAEHPDERLDLFVAKTVRVPRHGDEEKAAYELTAQDGLVSIRKASTSGKVCCTLADLETAVRLLK